MPTAMKTKINNIQTIELEQLSNSNQRNIAQINDKNIKLLPLESLDQNFLTIITKTTQVQEGGTTIPKYSLAFDLPQAVKDKINNNTRIIQIEPTSFTDLVYPLDLTPTDIFTLPLKTRANDFIDILLQPPASEGNGRSITIDLKDSIKTKINNIQVVSFSADGNQY